MNLDITFTALDRVARPVHPGLDHRGPPDARRGDPLVPAPAPVPAQHRAPLPELRPGARALKTAAPDLAETFDRARPRCAARPRSTAASRRCSAELQRFANDPVAPRGLKRLAETLEVLNPTLQNLAPVQTAVQLRHAVVPQRLLAAERGRRPRHLAALHHHRHAAGPEQRGRPLVGARQRRHADARQLPALQPVPEHRLAGPAEGVRGRQRAVPGRPQGDRQRPRQAAGQDGGARKLDGRPPAAAAPAQPAHGRADRAGDRARRDVPRLHQGHPVHEGFRVQAVFESANSLRPNSPVRIAGVNVGKVK